MSARILRFDPPAPTTPAPAVCWFCLEEQPSLARLSEQPVEIGICESCLNLYGRLVAHVAERTREKNVMPRPTPETPRSVWLHDLSRRGAALRLEELAAERGRIFAKFPELAPPSRTRRLRKRIHRSKK